MGPSDNPKAIKAKSVENKLLGLELGGGNTLTPPFPPPLLWTKIPSAI